MTGTGLKLRPTTHPPDRGEPRVYPPQKPAVKGVSKRLASGNSVYGWMNDRCIPHPDATYTPSIVIPCPIVVQTSRVIIPYPYEASTQYAFDTSPIQQFSNYHDYDVRRTRTMKHDIPIPPRRRGSIRSSPTLRECFDVTALRPTPGSPPPMRHPMPISDADSIYSENGFLSDVIVAQNRYHVRSSRVTSSSQVWNVPYHTSIPLCEYCHLLQTCYR